MRYPMFVNWAVFTRRSDGTYLVTDTLTEQRLCLSAEEARFARRLDGRTSPSAAAGRLGRRQAADLLRLFEELDLLRRSHVLETSFLSICWTAAIFRRNPPRRAAAWGNLALLALWLPVFALGVFLFWEAALPVDDADYIPGALAGLVPGVLLHELAHACAAWGYGGHVFEFGLCLHWLVPGAYVLTDVSGVRGSLRQTQIDAAGVELNFLLAGLFLIAASAAPQAASFLLGAAPPNFLLAVGNLLPVSGDDGGRGLASLLGLPELDSRARGVALRGARRKRLAAAGAEGKAAAAACVLVSILQLLWPLYAVSILLEVILL